jgi:hypothetical protein
MNNCISILKQTSALCLLIVFCAGYTLINPSDVYAKSFVIDIPSARTIRGVETPYLTGRATIPSPYVGANCEVSTMVSNDTSIHAESNLRVQTGNISYELVDVERREGVITQNSKVMKLSETITLHIVSIDKLGYSADAEIEIICPDGSAQEPLSPTPAPTQKPEQPFMADGDTPEALQFPAATGSLPRTGPSSILGLFFSSSMIGSYMHRRFRK